MDSCPMASSCYLINLPWTKHLRTHFDQTLIKLQSIVNKNEFIPLQANHYIPQEGFNLHINDSFSQMNCRYIWRRSCWINFLVINSVVQYHCGLVEEISAVAVKWMYLGAWWRHQMETFSALLVLCEGNPRSLVNSPHKGQWRGALKFSLILAWING